MAGLRRSTLPKRKGGKTTGVNRVNSCFSALSLFSSIHFPFLCAPTSIFFVFLTKSSRKRSGISNIFNNLKIKMMMEEVILAVVFMVCVRIHIFVKL